MPSLVPLRSPMTAVALPKPKAKPFNGSNSGLQTPKKSSKPERANDPGDLRLVPTPSTGSCYRPPLQITELVTDAKRISRLMPGDSIHLTADPDAAAALRKVLADVVLDISKPGSWSPNRFASISKVTIWTNDDPHDRAHAYEIAQAIFRSEDRRAKIRVRVADFDGDPLENNRQIWSSAWPEAIARSPKPGRVFELDPFKKRSEQLRTIEWVWQDTLLAGGTAILSGLAKAGKTVTAKALASCVVNGEKFLGRATRPGTAVYVAFEGNEFVGRARLDAMGGRDVILINSPGPATPDEGIQAILKLAVTTGASLVVIDTLQKLLPGVKLVDGLGYTQTCPELDRLAWIAKKTAAALLFLHHNEKSKDETSGNQGLIGGVDTVLNLKKRSRMLSSEQRYGVSLPPTKLRYDHASGTINTDRCDDDLAERILQVLDSGPCIVSELKTRLRRSAADIGEQLELLETAGEIYQRPRPRSAGRRGPQAMEYVKLGLGTSQFPEIGTDVKIPISPELINA